MLAAFLKAGSGAISPGALVHAKSILFVSVAVADLGSGFGAQMYI